MSQDITVGKEGASETIQLKVIVALSEVMSFILRIHLETHHCLVLWFQDIWYPIFFPQQALPHTVEPPSYLDTYTYA